MTWSRSRRSRSRRYRASPSHPRNRNRLRRRPVRLRRKLLRRRRQRLPGRPARRSNQRHRAGGPSLATGHRSTPAVNRPRTVFAPAHRKRAILMCVHHSQAETCKAMAPWPQVHPVALKKERSLAWQAARWHDRGATAAWQEALRVVDRVDMPPRWRHVGCGDARVRLHLSQTGGPQSPGEQIAALRDGNGDVATTITTLDAPRIATTVDGTGGGRWQRSRNTRRLTTQRSSLT